MMVNNEIGAIEPIEEIAKIIKAKNPNTIFHVDADSGIWKLPIVQRIWELTYYPQVVIRSMDQKESDFYISRKERRSLRSFSEADSRKEMVSWNGKCTGIVGLAVACEKMIGKNYENAERDP